jgi:hypothetical protein
MGREKAYTTPISEFHPVFYWAEKVAAVVVAGVLSLLALRLVEVKLLMAMRIGA